MQISATVVNVLQGDRLTTLIRSNFAPLAPVTECYRMCFGLVTISAAAAFITVTRPVDLVTVHYPVAGLLSTGSCDIKPQYITANCRLVPFPPQLIS